MKITREPSTTIAETSTELPERADTAPPVAAKSGGMRVKSGLRAGEEWPQGGYAWRGDPVADSEP
ncbi:MAG: hypothetical protein QM820_54985 [Minicystis sp.]